MSRWIFVLLSLLLAPSIAAQPKAETPQEFQKRTRWWQEAKFGMFIHWGVYSVLAGEYNGRRTTGIAEWIMHDLQIPKAEYEKFLPKFNPVKFNARQWARLARQAGMKYIVITSKHHDGFNIYDSKANPYNIMQATPFKRDPLRELAQACRAEGVRLGFYHSIMDWHHPDANAAGAERYIQVMKAQLKELITQYDPAILWFDGEWVDWWTEERGDDLERYVRSLKPSIIINNRVGKRTHKDGDHETPEQEIPASAIPGGRLWETCMTMNDTWGYSRFDHHWKSTRSLVQKLCDIAHKGGNFLLNVGPTGEGEIPQASVERLLEIGQWMSRNGEAIYGTKQSPVRRLSFNGRCTVKGNTLYLHVFEWSEGNLPVTGLSAAPHRVRVPGTGETLPFSVVQSSEGGMELYIARPRSLDPLVTVVALEFDRLPAFREVSASVKPDADGAFTLRASEAEIHGQTARYEEGGGKDNIGFWIVPQDYVTWSIQAPGARSYRVEITYACPPEEAGSEFEVRAGEEEPATETVQATGSWIDFRNFAVGSIAVQPGRQTISVKVRKMKRDAVMNLQSVRLIPIRQ
jgi:alpha-L-fucosidase